MTAAHHLLAEFHGHHVSIECGSEWLACELRRRLPLARRTAADGAAEPALLRIAVQPLDVSWIEVSDSHGHRERGSLAHVLFHLRKWITAAFVSAHADLLWLHAAAAARGDDALVLAGPAGAGKSTLLVGLINRAWRLLADDAVAVEPKDGRAFPLPFTPEVRSSSWHPDDAWQVFLTQPKTLAVVPADGVRSTPAIVRTIVFPQYDARERCPRLVPLTPVCATQALVPHTLGGGRAHRERLHDIVHFAQAVRCYRLRFADGDAAATLLAASGLAGAHAR